MESIKRIWQTFPLVNKLTTLVSILVTLTVFAVTFLSIQRERINFRDQLVDQATLLLDTIPLTMRDQLYFHEMDELADIATVVSRNEDITLFIVYNEDGQVLVNVASSELGLKLAAELLGRDILIQDAEQVYLDWQDGQLIAGRSVELGREKIGAVAIGLSTLPLDRKVAALTNQSILLGVATLIIGLIVTFFLARGITNPLRGLAQVSSKMAGGELAARAQIRSGDEIGHLGEAFNAMAEAIQKRETDLRQLAAELEKKVAERTAELSKQNEVLEQIAITDSLTNIYNRRHFFELAEIEIKRAIRYQHSLTLMLIDVDHFKEVNDSHGHLVGDQVLVEVTKLFKRNIRTVDILARFGGEEFVILMPEADRPAALNTAERLRTMISETKIKVDDIEVSTTISIGISSWEDHPEMTLDHIIGHADIALYQSKEAGRNHVRVYEKAG